MGDPKKPEIVQVMLGEISRWAIFLGVITIIGGALFLLFALISFGLTFLSPPRSILSLLINIALYTGFGIGLIRAGTKLINANSEAKKYSGSGEYLTLDGFFTATKEYFRIAGILIISAVVVVAIAILFGFCLSLSGRSRLF